MYTLYVYPKCSTCKKAQAYLTAKGVSFQVIDLVQETPTAQVIAGWLEQSEEPIRRFFNTSGQLYRAMGLKDQVPHFSVAEASEVLASDGMLLKRPILVKNHQFLTNGFKEAVYDELLAN